jgi:hypothetical protein
VILLDLTPVEGAEALRRSRTPAAGCRLPQVEAVVVNGYSSFFHLFNKKRKNY